MFALNKLPRWNRPILPHDSFKDVTCHGFLFQSMMAKITRKTYRYLQSLELNKYNEDEPRKNQYWF